MLVVLLLLEVLRVREGPGLWVALERRVDAGVGEARDDGVLVRCPGALGCARCGIRRPRVGHREGHRYPVPAAERRGGGGRAAAGAAAGGSGGPGAPEEGVGGCVGGGGEVGADALLFAYRRVTREEATVRVLSVTHLGCAASRRPRTGTSEGRAGGEETSKWAQTLVQGSDFN